MAYFAVSYQLNKQKDYQALWDEFARLGAHKAMNDYYLVDVNLTSANGMRDHLAKFVDEDDMLFVVKLESRPAPKRCFQGTAAWLDKHF